MAEERKISRVLFVNKFGPASNAITGQTAGELAGYLSAQGVQVRFLCIKAKYRSTQERQSVKLPYAITGIRDFYSGDSSIIRFIMGLIDGLRLFITSLFIKKDAVIVMTEPPLLFFWFQLFRWLYKAKLVYYTMDVYPDAFAAGGFIRRKNLVYKFFKKIVYIKPPDFLIPLGDEQRKFLEEQFRSPIRHAVLPCGIIHEDPEKFTYSPNGKIVFGYGGNMGAAHDAEFLVKFVKQLQPEKHTIVLSLYGTKAEFVRKELEGLDHIIYKKFLSHADIAALDVNIASLLPEWHHISVPSKAVTAVCCGSVLLLNACKTADAWQMLHPAAWLVEPASEYEPAIREFLNTVSKEAILAKRENAKRLAVSCRQDLLQAKQDILAYIHSLS